MKNVQPQRQRVIEAPGLLRSRLSRKLNAALAIVLLLPVPGVMAATYYVDSVGGSESNNGTSAATPWRDITSTAMVNTTTFQPGDQVLFKRGSTWAGTLAPKGSGTSTAPIVFDAYGTGDAPRIVGSGLAAVKLENKSYFTFQNFELTNPAASEGKRNGIYIRYSEAGSFSGLKVRLNEIHDVTGYTTRWNGEPNYTTGAIYLEFGSAISIVSNLLIESNYIHDTKCIGIQLKPGAFMGGHPEYFMTGVVIRGNLLETTGGDHILVQSCDAPLIEYNAGFDAGIIAEPNADLWIAGMWTCYYTRNTVFQFNEVARTANQFVGGLVGGDSMAFDVDFGTTGNHIFQYNYTHDNAGGTLLMMPASPKTGGGSYPPAAKTIIYRYNISVNDDRTGYGARQFSFSTVAGINYAHVYNNVIFNNRPNGFKVSDTIEEFYKNNIFYVTESANYFQNPRFSNNCYYGHVPLVNDPYKVVADPKFVGPLPAAGVTVPDAYTGLNPSNWVNATTANNVFKLQAGSPCINAGAAITAPISNGGRDFWNNSLYSGAPDIGAHEVVGGSGPAPGTVTFIDNVNVAPVSYSTPLSNWTFHTDKPNYDNSTVAVAGVVGSWVQCSFTGTNVTFVGTRAPDAGIVDISIDGGPPTSVDLYWPVKRYRQELFQVTGLTNSAHTIKITITGKNPAATASGLLVDYFQVLPGSPSTPPTVVAADDSAGTYSGSWAATTADDAYLGTLHTSSTVGDSFDFTFTGTGVRLYGPKSNAHGNMTITVNGVSRAVASYTPGHWPEAASRLFEVNGLPFGTYTLHGVIDPKDPNSNGNTVDIDLIETLTGGFPNPVNVDNPPSSSVVYTKAPGKTAWAHGTDAAYYGGTKSTTDQIGNSVTFSFSGTGVSLYMKKDSGIGKLSIQIDGGTAVVVDGYSPTPLLQQKVFEIAGLPQGPHTIKATVVQKNPASAANFIGIDYFTYQP